MIKIKNLLLSLVVKVQVVVLLIVVVLIPVKKMAKMKNYLIMDYLQKK